MKQDLHGDAACVVRRVFVHVFLARSRPPNEITGGNYLILYPLAVEIVSVRREGFGYEGVEGASARNQREKYFFPPVLRFARHGTAHLN